MPTNSNTERGQVVFPILGLLVILTLALALTIDFGRFFLLRSRVGTIADTAALAGAGARDIRQADAGRFSLNAAWAQDRASEVYRKTLASNPSDTWMAIQLNHVQVQGRTVTVTVTGSCEPIWGRLIGVHRFTTRVTASARAAVGITREH